MIRAFIAIDIPDDVRAAIDEAQARLKRAHVGVKISWTKIDNLHLTLQFLGYIEEAVVDEDQVRRCNQWRRSISRLTCRCMARERFRMKTGRASSGLAAMMPRAV